MESLKVIAIAIAGWGAIFLVLAKACERVEDAANSLSFRLRMPASVAGATLLATASSAPEFFTATSGAVIYGVFEVGLLTIVWSAIFNILVIPGCSSLASKQALTIPKEVVYRDGVGYLATVFVLLLVLADGTLTRADAGILLIIYIVYLHAIRLMAKAHAERIDEQLLEEPEHLLSMGKIALYFAVGLVIIGVGTHFMIEVGDTLGHHFAISILIFSALIFAPGTSIPDLLMSYFAAKRGDGAAAISNVFGSNVFDLTICLAVPILIVGDTVINLGPIWPSIIMLVLLQVMVLAFVRTSWRVDRWEGMVMIVAFFVCAVIFLFTLPESVGDAPAAAEEVLNTVRIWGGG